MLIGRALGPLGTGERVWGRLGESDAVRRRTLPAGRWLLASSRSTLGAHLTLARRFAEAESLLLGAERELTTTFGDASPLVVEARGRIAQLYTAWQRPAEAQAWTAKLAATP